MDVITGEKLQYISELVICTDNIRKFHKNILNYSKNIITLNGNNKIINEISDQEVNEIDKYNIIFVYTHLADSFLEKYLQKSSHKFVLITHNSDDEINVKFLKYLNHPNIIKWYGQNANIMHPKLKILPIGIANSQWRHGNLDIFSNFVKNKKSKNKLVYLNFKIGTNKSVRKPIYKLLSQKSFVTVNSNLSYQEYLEELAGHKFCIVPPGNGIDCHRTWECLYLGVIPILYNCICNQLFYNLNLPIVLVDDWNFDEKFLESQYKLINVREYNQTLLDMRYWINLINP